MLQARLVPAFVLLLLVAGSMETPAYAQPNCGCRTMTIEADAGQGSHIYCDSTGRLTAAGCVDVSQAPIPPTMRCAQGTPFQCPLGLSRPQPIGVVAGFAFESYVRLTDNSDLQGCTRGQYVQSQRHKNGTLQANPASAAAPPAGNHTLGGFTFASVVAPTLVPAIGATGGGGLPQFGADNYTSLSFNQRHIQGTDELFWWDWPGGALPVDPPHRRQETDEFIAFVEGNQGTCWCRFSIVQEWSDALSDGQATITRIAGQNCNLNR